MVDYAAARLNMVEGQIKPNKVIDQALIDAMMAVPRERFVPADRRGVAYVDEDVAIGGRRVLMEPRVLGRLLNDARITPDSRVLIVGAGTGYSAAIVARLAAKVVALEEDKALLGTARGALSELGVQECRAGRGAAGGGLAGRRALRRHPDRRRGGGGAGGADRAAGARRPPAHGGG